MFGCVLGGRGNEWELECEQLSLASPWRLPTSPKSAHSPLSPHCSTLSTCCHAMVAVIYPFTWQHTYIPVLPPAMIDIVCSPTPFLIGLLTSSLPLLRELPLEEVSSGRSPVPCLWGGAEGRCWLWLCQQAGSGSRGTPQLCLGVSRPKSASVDPQ